MVGTEYAKLLVSMTFVGAWHTQGLLKGNQAAAAEGEDGDGEGGGGGEGGGERKVQDDDEVLQQLALQPGVIERFGRKEEEVGVSVLLLRLCVCVSYLLSI